MWEQTQRIFVESLQRVLNGAAKQLPGVLAMLFLLLIAVVAALVLRAAVRRGCERLCFDRRLREWGFAGPPGEGQLVPAWRVRARSSAASSSAR
jgi:hypothetical protein